jgi:hypothetical protein
LVCFFSDDHCDIVPFLHSYFRGKKVPYKTPVVFFHVDAHSDLSIPSLSQNFPTQKLEDWENVDSLYDILSEEGGIAEFIVPLITTELISQVVWVRSEWSLEQLPDGLYTLQIRDHLDGEKYHPKINWKTPYYIEDNSFLSFTKGVPSEEELSRVKKKKRRLDGVESSPLREMDIHHLTTTVDRSCFFHYEQNGLIDLCPSDQTTRPFTVLSRKSEWILDICLDYFSTNNPFYDELLAIYHRNDKSEVITDKPLDDDYLIKMVQSVYQHLPYRQNQKLLSKIFDAVSSYKHCRQLLHSVLYDSIPEKQKEFLDLFSKRNDITPMITSFLTNCIFFSKELKDFIFEKGYLLLLPHHIVEEKEEIDAEICKLKVCILNFMNLIKNSNSSTDSSNQVNNGFPLFVTIATSQSDNYTSSNQFDYIYEQVFLMLEDLFCIDKKVKALNISSEIDEQSSGNQGLKIHDIRKEPIEMAYLINWKK